MTNEELLDLVLALTQRVEALEAELSEARYPCYSLEKRLESDRQGHIDLERMMVGAE